MSQDPYRAPTTKDLTPPQPALPTRPAAVKTACLLFCFTYCMALLTLIPGIRNKVFIDSVFSFGLMAVFMLLYTGLFVWLLKAMLNGKSWGRWTFLLFWLWCVYLIIADLPKDMVNEPLVTGINVVSTIIDLYSFSLLFFSAGGQWFAACKAARS
jgi:hypothetical protein